MRRWENISNRKYDGLTIQQHGTGCSVSEQSGICSALLQEFPGDCGTLTIQGLNNITPRQLEAVKDIASRTGFDTVIGTVVKLGLTDTDLKEIKDKFFKAGWKQAKVGKSNRKYDYNSKNTKIIYVLHISKCIHKGY